MNKPFIFLDIDGVLNDHYFNSDAQSCTIKQSCVNAFNLIIKELSPHVVLSSAWRYLILTHSMTINGFKNMLRTHGVRADIDLIDTTVSDEIIPTRGLQISQWVNKHSCENYLVLDDMLLDIKLCGHTLYQTNGSVGLTRDDADVIVNKM